MNAPSREKAVELLKKYNQDPFHLRHAYTVENVMRWFAENGGYADEADFWASVGLLHDVDFEKYPDQHCKKAPELLAEIGCRDGLIHAVCSHAWTHGSDVEPVHPMEKTLYAVDELTGLIYAASLMRPSRSCKDMEVSSLRKKFKDKKFAAGCSREIIAEGAELMGVELNELLEKTLEAMKACEDRVSALCG